MGQAIHVHEINKNTKNIHLSISNFNRRVPNFYDVFKTKQHYLLEFCGYTYIIYFDQFWIT